MDPEVAEIVRAANLALTRDPGLDSVLSTLLAHVGSLVPYDTANVMLLDADGKMRVRAHRGYERWADSAALMAIELDPTTLDHIQQMLGTGRSHVVADTAAHPGWGAIAATSYIRSWLGVPLLAAGEAIGMYSLDKSIPGFFTERHREITEALAPQAALSIRNARLYEQVRTHARTLEHEIAERRRVEAALRASEERFRLVAETAHDGILVADGLYVLRYANRAAGRVLGYEPAALLGRAVHELWPARFHEVYGAAFASHLVASQGQEAGRTFEVVALHASGAEVPVEVSLAVWNGPEGPVFTGILRDITERQRLLSELRELSLRDPLTAFYNRRGFATLAEQELKSCVRNGTRAVAAFVDVDDFKLINDSLGHDEGDRALLRVAEALRRTFRVSDIVARFGGDEFVVLALSADDQQTIAARLRASLAAVDAAAGRSYVLSLSIGSAVFDPMRPISVEALVAEADQAMYSEKRRRDRR